MARLLEFVTTCPEALFPRRMRDLLALGIDRAGVLAICREYGGRRMFVAEAPEKLANLIGEKAAALLIERYRGEILDIPSLVSLRAAERGQSIRNQHEKGASVNDLAREFGLSMRRIRTIIKAPAEPTPDCHG